MSKEKVRAAAIALAKEVGLINLTRQAICDRAGVPDGSFPIIMDCTLNELLASIKAEVPALKGVKVSKKRVSPALRKDHILGIILSLSAQKGYTKVTRSEIAEEAGVSESLVSEYFGTMPDMRRTIMRHAVLEECLTIIAQGLSANDPHAKKASHELRVKALMHLASED